MTQFLDAKDPGGRNNDTRLCADNLHLLKEHINSFVKVGKARCQVCGKGCFMKCKKCGLHYCLKSGTSPVTIYYSVDLHDDDFFGLTMDDKDVFLVL